VHISQLLNHDLVLAASAYVVGAFGLAGSLIGGAIAGGVSYQVARQAREAAETTWMRDTRRETYGRFLTGAQRLHVSCEFYDAEAGQETRQAIERARYDFFEIYAVVQVVAGRALVDAARTYGYRLFELYKEVVEEAGNIHPPDPKHVSDLVRLSRHDTIEAMRHELGQVTSARPSDTYNPFADTDLATRWLPDADKGQRGVA
jgi:hypothetical protein